MATEIRHRENADAADAATYERVSFKQNTWETYTKVTAIFMSCLSRGGVLILLHDARHRNAAMTSSKTAPTITEK